jgi:hypothetical protein
VNSINASTLLATTYQPIKGVGDVSACVCSGDVIPVYQMSTKVGSYHGNDVRHSLVQQTDILQCCSHREAERAQL